MSPTKYCANLSKSLQVSLQIHYKNNKQINNSLIISMKIRFNHKTLKKDHQNTFKDNKKSNSVHVDQPKYYKILVASMWWVFTETLY